MTTGRINQVSTVQRRGGWAEAASPPAGLAGAGPSSSGTHDGIPVKALDDTKEGRFSQSSPARVPGGPPPEGGRTPGSVTREERLPVVALG
jgi:hypothetical protein